MVPHMHKKHLNLVPARPTTRGATSLTDPAYLRSHHAGALYKLDGAIHHPRALARAAAHWQPIRLTLLSQGSSSLLATVQKQRVGIETRRYIQVLSGKQPPSFVVEVFLRRTKGSTPLSVAQAWMQALLPDRTESFVHYVSHHGGVRALWLADYLHQPLPSPSWIFAEENPAA